MASQQHLDRLSAVDAGFLAQEGRTRTCTSAASRCSRASRRALRRVARPHPRRGCTSSRATARSSPTPPFETGRPLWVDDPTFNLDYHVRHTALPRARRRGRAAARWPRACSPSGSTAPSRCGSCGWSRGLERRPLGADLEDPPRARRRRLRRRPHDVLFDLGPEVAAIDGAEPWIPQPEPSRAELAARGLTGAVRAAAEVATGALGAVAAPGRGARPRARGRRPARRGRVDGAQRAAGHAVQRRARPAPADRGRARGARRLQDGQGRVRRRRSTTSCSRSWPARSRYFLHARGRRTEGLELKAARAGVGALGRPARRARQPAHAGDGAAAGVPRRPDRAAALRQGGDGRAEGVAPGAGRRRRSRRCRASRRRPSSRRRRG